MLKDRKYYSSDEEYNNALDNEYIRFIKKLERSLKYDLCISNLLCKLKKIRNYILGETLEPTTEADVPVVQEEGYLVESSTYINIMIRGYGEDRFIKRNE